MESDHFADPTQSYRLGLYVQNEQLLSFEEFIVNKSETTPCAQIQ